MNEPKNESSADQPEPRNFLEQEIDKDLAEGRVRAPITRFPPEPNGYLHIGHAMAVCINYELAKQYEGGKYNLRFDDTNPVAEDAEFVEAIQADVRWLGYDWGERLYFSSDFFEELYAFAVELIESGKAYVDDQPVDEMRAGRGSAREPGVDSPFRARSVQENLDLFARMRAGEFNEGDCVLRAKIDMASAHMLMRDPVLYRILKQHHDRTGDEWCIYPTYDWAHGQCDALEGVTHSLCSLEFANHRPLYDWCLDHITAPSRPRQIEFGRLAVSYTVISKRKLTQLVSEGHVSGWDDPRMPTLRGMRRRGFSPTAFRKFVERVGVGRINKLLDYESLAGILRDELNKSCARRMAVLRPLKVTITNLAEGESIDLEAVNNPEDEGAGTRPLRLTREVWIERSDFMEDAPKKFFRLAPEREVRLRYAFVIRCDEVVKDEAGEVVELRCTYDAATGGGKKPEGRKVKGVIHWVSAEDAVECEVRLYDHLFSVPEPLEEPEGGTWLDNLNPDSLEVLTDAKLEPILASEEPGARVQFERIGYFCVDTIDSTPGQPVYNRTVGLRDSWSKKQGK